MLTEQHIKEGLSKSYVKAVANRAGFNCSEFQYDYGMDGTIEGVQYRENRMVMDGFKLDYQLKSTTNVEFKDGYIIYDLESKNYNDLINSNVGTPRILILFILCTDQSKWLTINCDNTIFQKCAWWISLKNEEMTLNKTKKTIKIPNSQIFDVENLVKLMYKVKNGEELWKYQYF